VAEEWALTLPAVPEKEAPPLPEAPVARPAPVMNLSNERGENLVPSGSTNVAGGAAQGADTGADIRAGADGGAASREGRGGGAADRGRGPVGRGRGGGRGRGSGLVVGGRKVPKNARML
jgi:hypothetical protein